MNPPNSEPTARASSDVTAWLRTPMTVTLPRWALLAGAVAAVVLLLVALD